MGLFYGANSLAAREAAVQATQAPSSRRRLHAGAARWVSAYHWDTKYHSLYALLELHWNYLSLSPPGHLVLHCWLVNPSIAIGVYLVLLLHLLNLFHTTARYKLETWHVLFISNYNFLFISEQFHIKPTWTWKGMFAHAKIMSNLKF